MKYTNLYKNISNPLDDPMVIEQLIDAYSEGSSFYTALTNRHSKDKKMYYSKASCDALHAQIFNRWKKELLSITKEQYEKAIKDKLYKRDIFKLLSFLKTVPDVKTKEEANAILNKSFADKELEEAMESYRWDSIGLYSGWTHISERHINGKKTIIPNIEHRLYINSAPMDVHTMSKIFMDKCVAKKLPFYFKIGEFDKRDDNIVIYSDTKYLPQYLNVLREIEIEYPELVKRCGKPPILSGVIHNWIGYGSEPLKLSGEESFNGIRAKSIEQAIEKELINWYKVNGKALIKENGKQMTIQEYIAERVVQTKISNMIKIYKRNPNAKYIKYTEAEVSSPAFIQRMTRLVKQQMPTVFSDYINGKKASTKIDVPIKQDVSTTLYSSDIIRELKAFIGAINANDPTFAKKVQARIKKDAISKGIDPNKYCFDLDNVELLRKAEQESEKTTAQTTETHKKQPTRPVERDESSKYHRPAGTPTHYRPMTASEILDAQRKLAECPPVKVKRKPMSGPVKKENSSKYHRPAGTPTYYRPMTAAEILESQRKLAECPPVKVKRK